MAKNKKVITTIIVYVMFYNTISYANTFWIHENSTKENIRCKEFVSKKNEGKVLCSDAFSSTTWMFRLNDVSVYYDNQRNGNSYLSNSAIKIYPVAWDVKEISKQIENENCTQIIKGLYGGYFIENKPEAYLLMAYLYEKGICQEKSLGNALDIYTEYLSSGIENQYVYEKVVDLKFKLTNKDIAYTDNNGYFYECDKYKFNVGFIECRDESNDVVDLTPNNIKKIQYKGKLLYPYNEEWDKDLDINSYNIRCDDYAVLGDLIFENSINARIVEANQYENGQCGVTVNKLYALDLLRSVYREGYTEILPRIKLLEEDLEEQRKLEEEIRIEKARKRAQEKENKDKKDKELRAIWLSCQEDCSVNQYEYDKSCHSACLKHQGYWILFSE